MSLGVCATQLSCVLSFPSFHLTPHCCSDFCTHHAMKRFQKQKREREERGREGERKERERESQTQGSEYMGKGKSLIHKECSIQVHKKNISAHTQIMFPDSNSWNRIVTEPSSPRTHPMKSTEVLNPRRMLQWLLLHNSYNTSPKLCRNGALWSILYIATPFYDKCKALEI